MNLINVCTIFDMGRMHGIPRTNSKLHKSSKFSKASFFFSTFACIFTINDL